MDIREKYGLVTGGAEGIGKVLVENLLQKGAKGVAILDVNEAKGEETKKELEKRFENRQILFQKCDVSSKDQMRGAFQEAITKFGRLHIVCNNAGIVDEPNWERMLQINLNGAIHGTLLAIEFMDASEGGAVINISSSGSLLGSGIQFPVHVYTAAKCALNAFSRNIALSDPIAKKKGVRVNILCPMKVIDKPTSSATGATKQYSADQTAQKAALAKADIVGKIKAGTPNPFAKVTCTMQDVADTMLMFIENDYNGHTATPIEGRPTIVEDCHQRFRERLQVDYTKIMEQL